MKALSAEFWFTRKGILPDLAVALLPWAYLAALVGYFMITEPARRFPASPAWLGWDRRLFEWLAYPFGAAAMLVLAVACLLSFLIHKRNFVVAITQFVSSLICMFIMPALGLA